jgi:hypothetical protein
MALHSTAIPVAVTYVLRSEGGVAYPDTDYASDGRKGRRRRANGRAASSKPDDGVASSTGACCTALSCSDQTKDPCSSARLPNLPSLSLCSDTNWNAVLADLVGACCHAGHTWSIL